MPGKLQNKRSSTLNNPPSAGTLAAGEIALNTNADSANLHFEDAGGGVRSIGADPTAAGTYVRNVSGANEVGTWTELEIPPGTIIDTDPPVDPPDGQLFFNEDNQTLWVWSEAQNTWAPAVPQVPTGGGGDYSSAELTEKVFFINEQEVNEDYTVTGTDNAGSFGPIDIANGKNVTIADGGTWTVCGGAGRSVDPAGLWSRDGSTGTLTPANPGDDIETTGDLSATDGEFTGEIIAAGKVKANAFERETLQSNGGINLSAGKCFLRQDGAGNNVFGVFQGGDSEADNMTFSVTGIGGINASYLISTMPDGEDNAHWSTFAGRDGSDGNKVTCNITADGNVEVAGYITGGDPDPGNVKGDGYVNLDGPQGMLFVRPKTSTDVQVLSNNATTALITAEGNISTIGDILIQDGTNVNTSDPNNFVVQNTADRVNFITEGKEILVRDSSDGTGDGRQLFACGYYDGLNFNNTFEVRSNGKFTSGQIFKSTSGSRRGVTVEPQSNYTTMYIQCKSGITANNAIEVWQANAQRWAVNFSGTASFSNAILRLDPDNPDSWQTKEETYEEQITGPLGKVEKTVTKTREVKDYVGPTISVLDELQSLRKRATQQDAVIAQLVTALRSQGVQIDTTDIQEGN